MSPYERDCRTTARLTVSGFLALAAGFGPLVFAMFTAVPA